MKNKVYLITQYRGDGYEGMYYTLAVFKKWTSASAYKEKYNALLEKQKDFYQPKYEDGDIKTDVYSMTDQELDFLSKLNYIQEHSPVEIEEFELR